MIWNAWFRITVYIILDNSHFLLCFSDLLFFTCHILSIWRTFELYYWTMMTFSTFFFYSASIFSNISYINMNLFLIHYWIHSLFYALIYSLPAPFIIFFFVLFCATYICNENFLNSKYVTYHKINFFFLLLLYSFFFFYSDYHVWSQW